MLTEAEYKEMKQRLEEERRKAEEEYRKDLEAIDRVYEMKKRSISQGDNENVRASLPLPTRQGGVKPLGNGRQKIGRGELKKAVTNIVKSFQNNFTIIAIAAALKSRCYAAKNTSIRPVLVALQKTGEIELVAHGIGRTASVYRNKIAHDSAK